MLLIIFMGLIAKLTFVSGECDVGTQHMDDFDFTKFSGPRRWYLMLHKYNEMENDIDCPFATFGSPTGNRSSTTSKLYVNSIQRHIIQNGYVTNWNSSGYFELYHESSVWSGPFYVLAVKYDSYFIAKHCPFDSNELFIYVAFRSSRPDLATVWEVLKKLRDNNIDDSQLVNISVNHCPSKNVNRSRKSHIQTMAQELKRNLLRL